MKCSARCCSWQLTASTSPIVSEAFSMRRVLAATWISKLGAEDRIRNLLTHLAADSRQEPGCLTYIVHQSADDPLHFLLYEVYRDADALRAHGESAHFKRYVL